ncbi:MAG: PAS domain S-box protein, partial [Thermoanaerobaculia bacterium]|nr:PAS domain S-box protein [Thermoanaerobaculia bacterium]
MSGVTTRLNDTWRLLSVVSAVIAIAIAGVNRLGWLVGSRSMVSWGADIGPMKITGSLTVLAIAVPMLRISWRRRIDRTDRIFLRIAGAVALLAGLYGVGGGIFDRISAGSFMLPSAFVFAVAEDPLRIPMASGISFLLFAAALWLVPLDRARRKVWSSSLALLAAANSILTIFGYVYRVPSFYGENLYVPMPLPVAVALLLLAVTFTTSNLRSSALSVVLADTIGASTARRLLPAAILAPVALGFVHILLEEHAWMGSRLATAADSTLLVLLFSGLILLHTTRLHHREKRLEKLRAERSREAEQRRLFWDLSEDLLCTAGMDGYLRTVNPSWSRILGWTEDELLAKPFIEMVHPEDRESTLEEASNLKGGRNVYQFANRYRCRDGTYRTIQWNTVSVTERDEMFGVGRDITETVKARERLLNLNRELEDRVKIRTRELQATNKELEAFSYSISHDLRSPLRAIEGFSRIVTDRYRENLPPEGQHYLQRVRAGATKMSELIDGLLKLSRLNRAKLSIERVDLSRMAADVVRDLRAADPDRQVDIV